MATVRAHAGGERGMQEGSSSASHDRGNRPTTVRHGGCVLGHGVWPSVRTTTASGRGCIRRALVKPERGSVPPPPTSGIPSARHSVCATGAAASQGRTVTRSRRPPTAREIAATSRSALPSSTSLTDADERLLRPPPPPLRGASRTAGDALGHPEPDRVPLLLAEAVRAVRPQVPLPLQPVGAAAAVQPGQVLRVGPRLPHGGAGRFRRGSSRTAGARR